MKLIDISHILDENTPVYPGDAKLSLSEYKSLKKDHYCSFLLKSCLHTGTHIDIPMHLLNDGRFISDFPLGGFIGNGVFLDVCGEDTITMKHRYEEIINEGDIVLLYTGFDRYYNTGKYFTNHPVLCEELTGFLISKNIKLLGMDMPSPDYSPFPIHKALLSKGIFILENLANLNSLSGVNNFEVIALPLKISAEASFVRAVCRID